METQAATLERLKARFGGLGWSHSADPAKNCRITVPAEQAYDYVEFLKQDCLFDLLIDVTCVDYLYFRGAQHRFGVVYCLASAETGERITVRTHLDEPELSIRSIVPLWEAANWLEREVFDMFGIEFLGHPDLRRVLLPDEFAGFPLRKDYPLRGRGERHNFQRITRRQS
jgi:NADH-quinone oxidoreductase subunit C